MDALRRRRRLAIFVALVALQAIFVIGIVVREERLRGGAEIVLESRPVDPRDPLRGDFIVLSYVAEDLSAASMPGGRPREGDTVFVEFEQRGRYWVPMAVHAVMPSGDDLRGNNAAVRARVTNVVPLRVSYPNLGTYFVPQGEGNPPSAPDVVVSVSEDGTARIDHLEINGRRWP